MKGEMEMEKTLISREIYAGKILRLRVDDVELPSGKIAKREIVEHPGAVAIVALTENKEIVLIRQYRKATEEVMWEIPAGKIESNEEPLDCAMRELQEETGFRAKNWKKLLSFYTSPGFSDEILHLYSAERLQRGEQCLEEDEEIRISILPLGEAVKKMAKGQIRDGKTIIGILLSQLASV
jgi:ADP-ribose pyrophosphatase